MLQSPAYFAKEYRIQPGDQLDIKPFYNPDLNELLTVRPDGRTSPYSYTMMSLLQAPSELTAVLTKDYAPTLTIPKWPSFSAPRLLTEFMSRRGLQSRPGT